MVLYEILVNKPCIWILKALYDQEIINKKAHTISLSKISSVFNLKEKADYFTGILLRNGLLHIDDVGNDKIISLTQKGKDFFKQFHRLKIMAEIEKVPKSKKFASIEYNLTGPEKKTLLMAYRLSRESGEIPIKNLIRELNPYNSKKYSVSYKHLGRLEKLNLIAKLKKGKSAYISLTVPGKRTIKEQLIESVAREFE